MKAPPLFLAAGEGVAAKAQATTADAVEGDSRATKDRSVTETSNTMAKEMAQMTH